MIELMAETAAPVFGRGYIAAEPGLDDGARHVRVTPVG